MECWKYMVKQSEWNVHVSVSRKCWSKKRVRPWADTPLVTTLFVMPGARAIGYEALHLFSPWTWFQRWGNLEKSQCRILPLLGLPLLGPAILGDLPPELSRPSVPIDRGHPDSSLTVCNVLLLLSFLFVICRVHLTASASYRRVVTGQSVNIRDPLRLFLLQCGIPDWLPKEAICRRDGLGSPQEVLHRSDVNTKKGTFVGKHFCGPGHSGCNE